VNFYDLFLSPIIIQSFIIGIFSGILFGLVGVFIVIRRIGYLAGAVAHCAFGGIGVGIGLQYFLSSSGIFLYVVWLFDPVYVGLFVGILSALLAGFICRFSGEREDTIIGAIWAIGMSAGLFFVAIIPNSRNISDYLFGTIIFNTRNDVFNVIFVCVGVFLVVLLFFKRIEAVCFDEEFVRLRGVNTAFYFQLLLILSAVVVVSLVHVVGIVLVIAMLTLPAAAACRFTHKVSSACALASIFGVLGNCTGIAASVCLNSPPGPTIVIVVSILYFVSIIITKINK
jgi:zinc transport system permease protein